MVEEFPPREGKLKSFLGFCLSHISYTLLAKESVIAKLKFKGVEKEITSLDGKNGKVML